MEEMNFLLIYEEEMKRPQCTFRHYMHKITGIPVYQIDADDLENTFAILLRTPPKDSKGTIHVLEHMVLSGSRKYPLSDPFFSLYKRNFPTCCNAFIGDDYTCFFASSQLSSDFYRVFDVYLDAVFHPLLMKEAFLREAYRLEKGEAKGVVFNEMKGYHSNPESILWESLKAQLFPDTYYAFNPGGMPLSILELSHEEVCLYHREYYSPEQATFCFYGNIPIESHLAFLEKQIFQNIPRRRKAFVTKPVSISTIPYTTVAYPGEKNQAEQIFGIAWILGPARDPSLSIFAQVFEKLLVGHDGALLSEKLIESGFCVQVNGSVSEDLAYVVFRIEMYGVEETSAQKCEKIVLDYLQEIQNSPIPLHQIDYTKNKILMDRLEITAEWTSYGLETLLKGAIPSLWGGQFADFISSTFVLKTLDALTEDMLQKNIGTRLLGNSPRASSLLVPEKNLSIAHEIALSLLIEEKIAKINPENLVLHEQELEKFKKNQSEKKEDESCLPETPLSEIGKVPFFFDWKHLSFMKKTHVLHLETNTNGFVYLDLFFPITDSNINLAHLSIWAEVLTKNGSTEQKALERLQRIEKLTSSFEANTVILPCVDNSSTHVQAFLHLHVGFFERFFDDVIDLLLETKEKVTFKDEGRSRQILSQLASENSVYMNENAHDYVEQLSCASRSLGARLESYTRGLHFYETVLLLQKEGFSKSLIEKGCHLLQQGPSDIMICCEKEVSNRLTRRIESLESETFFSKGSIKIDPEMYPLSSMILLWPTAVHHHAAAMPIEESICPKINSQLWASILKGEKLLPEIRERGGAYGASARYKTDWKHLIFSSYRDPRSEETLLFFRSQFQESPSLFLTESTLRNAKRDVLKKEDLPIFPEMRGLHTWYQNKIGLSYEKQCFERLQILNETPEKMISIIEEQILFWNKNNFTPHNASFSPQL